MGIGQPRGTQGGTQYRWALLVLLSQPLLAAAGKVLLFPYGHGYTSRLVDVLKMGHLLRDAGHQVAVLVNQADQKHLQSLADDDGGRAGAHFHVFPAPLSRRALIDDEAVKMSLIATDNTTSNNAATFTAIVKNHLATCEQLLKSPEVLAEARAARYELLIVDVVDNCGRLVSQHLGVPTMPYSSTGLIVDQALFPNLPSFVPAPMSSFTSVMTFWERVQNMLMFALLDRIAGPYFFDAFERLRDRYNLTLAGGSRDFRVAYADQLFLAHADFALDDPRPLLPNVVLVGGLFVGAARPLEPDLEQFMVGAGQAGVVVVSFGSLIKQMDAAKAAAIARALAALPQRVVWRYDGPRPGGLGPNTRLLTWLPQNDLLAHRATRLFVTHCGIHGTYEAARHGVPVVAVPLMFDQHANAVKLVKRAQMGVFLDFKTLTESTFGMALREVLTNTRYKANAVTTSLMLRDHPQTPKERFLFWVDYVIRNKGIGRMVLEPMTYMGTFQLYCIDAMAFLFVVLAFSVVLLVWSCRLCCQCLCSRVRRSDKMKTM